MDVIYSFFFSPPEGASVHVMAFGFAACRHILGLCWGKQWGNLCGNSNKLKCSLK